MKRNTDSTTIEDTSKAPPKTNCAQSLGILSALNTHEGKLLYGAPVARKNNAKTLRLLNALKSHSSCTPGIAVIYLGNNPDDKVYRSEIIKQAHRIGMPVSVHGLPGKAEQSDVEKLIGLLNNMPEVSGILVQTMHDKALRRVAHACLNPAKDPEGVTAFHRQKLFYGEGEILPCTPEAIRLLIKETCGGNLRGKTVAIVNCSPVIGLPLSEILAYEGATITLCNNQTKNLAKSTRDKDVLVAAVGATNIIQRKHIGKGQIVIDAAIVRENGRVLGCVQIEKVIDKVSLITPVPGGVGPVTTSILLDNTAKLFAGSLGLCITESEHEHTVHYKLHRPGDSVAA
ncbi:MAG: bifunctional 5,10-methylenetetrahydrofolate dehydrogenase/5,10-methenyltetrahydrofolate cyclohydrolase [Candidatus Obscuribacterales bacterium]|nr:bifunctional 5,10-methylenetetrahydrofolate dehydrogenase/5,10-methenyltetrahydrofolate cyclohydrolase [Candidatus Obscuribacterales bacterium]